MTNAAAWPAELLGEPWAMEQKAFQAFVARVAEAMKTANAERPGAAPKPERKLTVEADGTARIPIRGALMRAIPRYFAWYDIPATAYPDLEADLEAALADSSVARIQFDVDSAGGSSAGLKRVADAIFAARGRKPMVARVEEIAASAAYWLAAQTDRISAGPMALVGSIGAYLAFMDMSSLAAQLGIKVEVFSSGALKGAGVPGTSLSLDQRNDLQKFVDDVTSRFVGDVARGRGMAEAKVLELATGETWLAEEAVGLGLVDWLETSQELTARRAPRAGAKAEKAQQAAAGAGAQPEAGVNRAPEDGGDTTMDEKQLADAQRTAAEEARAAERKRTADIKAAFTEDPAFALSQIETGVSQLEAKAAYADHLKAKLGASETARADAEQKLAIAQRAATAGAPPVPVGGGRPAPEAATGDFMAAARAYREEGGKDADGKYRRSMRESMSEIAFRRPELHRAYKEFCASRAAEVHERKASLGMENNFTRIEPAARS